ncbi:hypothetical protein [Aquimarina sp. 2201CG14-23]|uniref:hypothetical protein n=1 Tax=Aquimarina mycalae TaxID=3040073 RepID=UPI002477CD2B|nr:hypothetical protein [Aquimarina sp. 2201CG14-23]MDH7444670.1 hypothetical protein [Aquimarina sp. 2201CG14-23]
MKTKRVYIPTYVRSESGFEQDQKEFDFVITTDKRDSYGTVFTNDGWGFERYKDNPVVFYQHRSSGDDPDNLIGRTVKGPWKETLSDGSQAWVARVRLEDEDVNPKAEKIRKKIIAGSLRMASIGADVHDYRMGKKDQGEDENDVYFTRQDLFEWSVVNIGSNTGANVKRAVEIFQEIRSELSADYKSAEDQEDNKKNGLSVSKARLAIYKSKSKYNEKK